MEWREKLNKEAKEEESKHVKREVEGERGRSEIQRICVERLSGEVFRGALSRF